jgi:hypothetical protein
LKMNLRSWIDNVCDAVRRPVTAQAAGPARRNELFFTPMTLLPVRHFAVALVVFAGCLLPAFADSTYTTNGTEFPIVGNLPGDQVLPDVALSANGGVVVWQDNATDGSGTGISARRVDSTLSGTYNAFRVNVQATNDQKNARVTLLKNGGAVFVWQGGQAGSQHIFARYLSTNSTWLSASDLAVSAFNTSFQVNPAVTTLSNGNVVVVWASFNQAKTNSLMDVYAKILSPTGATVKSEFLVNQFIGYNQRSPSVAALNNGGFIVTWVSEQQRIVSSSTINQTNGTMTPQISLPSVDIYGRIFQNTGTASGNEFIVNVDSNPCANPAVAAASDGSFLVAWSARDVVVRSNGWDVCIRSFSTNGSGGNVAYANTYITGNQYAPRLASIGTDYLVVWTSTSQDGSREGVYGRFVLGSGMPTGNEFRVNATTISQQMQPVVASDSTGQFAVVWTSFTGDPYSFDLFAQRYVNVNSLLSPMPAPFVYVPFVLNNNVYQPRLQVSWAPLAGISVSNYEVYVDGASVPSAITTSNVWTMTAAQGLATNSTHSFQVDYVKADGKRPLLSAPASGTTWSGLHWQGIPYEWMQGYFGNDINHWPSASVPVAGNGPSLMQIFLSGGNPLDSSTWLTTQINNTKQGMFLSWNTQPGFTYQVQISTNFNSWVNLGSPRFAAGNSDSLYLGTGNTGFYRVLLVR